MEASAVNDAAALSALEDALERMQAKYERAIMATNEKWRFRLEALETRLQLQQHEMERHETPRE